MKPYHTQRTPEFSDDSLFRKQLRQEAQRVIHYLAQHHQLIQPKQAPYLYQALTENSRHLIEIIQYAKKHQQQAGMYKLLQLLKTWIVHFKISNSNSSIVLSFFEQQYQTQAAHLGTRLDTQVEGLKTQVLPELNKYNRQADIQLPPVSKQVDPLLLQFLRNPKGNLNTINQSLAQNPLQLNQFKITGVLGKGAMGMVLKGENTQLDMPVAIKTILHPGDNSIENAQRLAYFIQEARNTAKIQHPNCVRVQDLIRIDEKTSVIISEFIEGKNGEDFLRDMISSSDSSEENNLLSDKSAARFLLQVADGIQAIHRKNLVHQDIKLANIMVFAPEESALFKLLNTNEVLDQEIIDEYFAEMGGNSIKVNDMGLSMKAEDIMPGPAGTPLYMPPEMFVLSQDVNGIKVSKKSDIYAFGAMMYELLTKKRFDHALAQHYLKKRPQQYKNAEDVFKSQGGDILQLISNHKGKSAISPEDPHLQHVSKEMIDLMVLCTSTNPKERPNISEVIKDLKIFLYPQTQKNITYQQLLSIFGIALTVILLTGGFAFYSLKRDPAHIRLDIKSETLSKDLQKAYQNLTNTSFDQLSNLNDRVQTLIKERRREPGYQADSRVFQEQELKSEREKLSKILKERNKWRTSLLKAEKKIKAINLLEPETIETEPTVFLLKKPESKSYPPVLDKLRSSLINNLKTQLLKAIKLYLSGSNQSLHKKARDLSTSLSQKDHFVLSIEEQRYLKQCQENFKVCFTEDYPTQVSTIASKLINARTSSQFNKHLFELSSDIKNQDPKAFFAFIISLKHLHTSCVQALNKKIMVYEAGGQLQQKTENLLKAIEHWVSMFSTFDFSKLSSIPAGINSMYLQLNSIISFLDITASYYNFKNKNSARNQILYHSFECLIMMEELKQRFPHLKDTPALEKSLDLFKRKQSKNCSFADKQEILKKLSKNSYPENTAYQRITSLLKDD